MSPGSVTERLSFFVGEYFDGDKVSEGGGLEEDGEEIEVLELPLHTALAMIDSGEIADAKTIMCCSTSSCMACWGSVSSCLRHASQQARSALTHGLALSGRVSIPSRGVLADCHYGSRGRLELMKNWLAVPSEQCPR